MDRAASWNSDLQNQGDFELFGAHEWGFCSRHADSSMLTEHQNLGRQHDEWGSEQHGTFSCGSLISLSKTVFENASWNVVCLFTEHRIARSICLPARDRIRTQPVKQLQFPNRRDPRSLPSPLWGRCPLDLPDSSRDPVVSLQWDRSQGAFPLLSTSFTRGY